MLGGAAEGLVGERVERGGRVGEHDAPAMAGGARRLLAHIG